MVLPFAHLPTLAQHYWGVLFPRGFVPRFETTRQWALRLRPVLHGPDDWTGDLARDLFTARAWIDRAGLSRWQDVLLHPVIEAAAQLAPVAAALAPAERTAWAARARPLLDVDAAPALQVEWTACRLALEWVAASSHATDVLFEPAARSAAPALVVVQGVRHDALASALVARWQGQALALELLPEDGPPVEDAPRHRAHAAAAAEDEALCAAACVLGHVRDGRTPVALVDNDRALTRRVGALLRTAGVALCDETGWTLSTTRAASALMAVLRAAAWDAISDVVLDWLKHCPVAGEAATAELERWLRRQGRHRWTGAVAGAARAPEAVQSVITQAESWRARLAGTQPLAGWLAALQQQLQETGLWSTLEADAAGQEVLRALRLGDEPEAEVAHWQGAARPVALAELQAWVRDVLEAQRFVPGRDATAAVVVLPLMQTLGRPFAAAVVPGCDERRLQAAPEPPGPWTVRQRETLGLPTREALARAQQRAWDSLRQFPSVDVLWRLGDDGGEPLLPSVLVQQWQLHGWLAPGEAPLRLREVPLAPVARPAAVAPALVPARISASAYADLRHCPYRFFALRQLGLQEAEELDDAVEKRDVGNWLHAVLQQFHETRALGTAARSLAEDRAALDAAAEAVVQSQGLGHAGFVPFRATWPQLREGYLQWLEAYEAREQGRFVAAEQARQVPWRGRQLVGTIDRIDEGTREGHTVRVLIDYKTEAVATTAQRVRAGTEDLQLAFYAALVAQDAGALGQPVVAAYLHVGERGETRWFEQPGVEALRDRLLEGLAHDLDRMTAGHALQALGEGVVCERCAARGLCRKDFWDV